MSLKKYRIHWTADIRGYQDVEAFDEDDAAEQFDSIIHEDGMPNEPVYAELEEIELIKPEKKAKKK